MAGPATTGNAFILNNMEGEPIPLPASASLEPGEELNIVMQMRMHAGMDGPHLFRLRLAVDGQGDEAQSTLELYVRGFFG